MFSLDYETPKIIKIRSWELAIINHIIQLAILTYVIGYVVLYNKGYQTYDLTPISAISTKVKGVGYMFPTISKNSENITVIDMADYQYFPPVDNNAFYIPTNIILTEEQTQSNCSEDPSIPHSNCILQLEEGLNGCKLGRILDNGNGIETGRCVPIPGHLKNWSHLDNKTDIVGVCEIRGWCPVQTSGIKVEGGGDPGENGGDELGTNLLYGAENFTIFIKNAITFTKFGVKRRNVADSLHWDSPQPELDASGNLKYLKTCRYSEKLRNWDCPIFTVGDLLSFAGTTYPQVARDGAIVAMKINWDCNLDLRASRCAPSYTFSRVDDDTSNFSRGWNFRYAQYYKENGVEKRKLVKIFGVRCLIFVTGSAGKFNIVPLLVNVGSGLALMGLTTVICDLIILYMLKNKDVYKARKYESVDSYAQLPTS